MDSSIAVTSKNRSFSFCHYGLIYQYHYIGFNDSGMKKKVDTSVYGFGIDGHGGRIRDTYPIPDTTVLVLSLHQVNTLR